MNHVWCSVELFFFVVKISALLLNLNFINFKLQKISKFICQNSNTVSLFFNHSLISSGWDAAPIMLYNVLISQACHGIYIFWHQTGSAGHKWTHTNQPKPKSASLRYAAPSVMSLLMDPSGLTHLAKSCHGSFETMHMVGCWSFLSVTGHELMSKALQSHQMTNCLMRELFA